MHHARQLTGSFHAGPFRSGRQRRDATYFGDEQLRRTLLQRFAVMLVLGLKDNFLVLGLSLESLVVGLGFGLENQVLADVPLSNYSLTHPLALALALKQSPWIGLVECGYSIAY